MILGDYRGTDNREDEDGVQDGMELGFAVELHDTVSDWEFGDSPP